MKNTIIKMILALSACLSITSCDKQMKKEEAWDFVITAKEAELKGDELTLTTNSEHLFAFTDRPNRKFATLSIEDWTKAWNEGSDSFEKDPPNAVLVGTNLTGDEQEVLVEIELMSAPKKVSGGFLLYIRDLTGVDRESKLRLGRAALYIDPKLKTRRSAAKRFKITGTGKVLREDSRHLLENKTPKMKRKDR